MTTVTEDGSEGRARDHFTFSSPILGSDSLPAGVIFQRALAVNRTAWRGSLRDLNRGVPIAGRLPLSESKKLR